MIFQRCIVLLFFTPWFSVQAADKWVTIGDSLTKEYEIEFPILNLSNPAAWGERNWLELLSIHRGEYVDIGPYANVWADLRIRGHEYNWAFPGSKTTEWREVIEATFLSNALFVFNRALLDGYLGDVADRVVIFLGGNDLKGAYRRHYEGADPTLFISEQVANITLIVDHIRSQNDTVPILLVNMPDVGITPVVKNDPKYADASKRQRMTDLTNDLNDRLRELAKQKDIGFADIASLTNDLSGPRRYVIGGVHFLKTVDPETLSNDPVYLFSPDGFHPNTTAQLLFANAIARGFNERYPELDPVPLFSTEEMLNILGLEPDMPLAEWAAAYGIDTGDGATDSDGDGASLLEEFALGMDPRYADAERRAIGYLTNERLELSYNPRVADSDNFTIAPQFSTDLLEWPMIPIAQQSVGADGTTQAWVSPHAEACFLRLSFTAP
ncbi:MAG: hypothetical protein GWQ05_14855 [Verrucomicrobiaceae bacterium]|nr:hypothetical protein [Verrucomicrobiaceae bacterium]